MSSQAFPALDITPMWARINAELVELLDLIPDDKLDWSPSPQLWNFKGILLHIVIGRHGLMQMIVKDGKQAPDVMREGQTADGLKEQLRVSWQRMAPFLSDASQLAREYDVPFEGQTKRLSGHWLASGQLEHDIHHRADIYHYLGQLGVEHGEPDALARRLREG